jgi:glycosyltransferase involved in cell wall biosynthesis
MPKNKNKKIVSANGKPTVSVCTPTYNRRQFIPTLIQCFKDQTYPKQLIEWIVVDDGTDPVGDLFEGVECVKYIRVEEKMKLGAKRNFIHSQCKGEILVYMDDDDYYPPERINEAVNKLRSKPKALACGSSKLLVYFKHNQKIYEFGPYGQSHATAGTFAFYRQLLKETSYDENAEMAEERHFLKDYSIPFVQLNPEKTILVLSHDTNTFDKKQFIDGNLQNPLVKETQLKLKSFVKNKKILEFYKSI